MLIVVEGPNGVGKTTVAAALVSVLQYVGCPVYATAEPSRSPLGRAIRSMEGSLPPLALALSCFADRVDHVAREVTPQLQEGFWIVCDRYVPSSLVLQRLDGFDLQWIWQLNKDVVEPNLTVYLEDQPHTIQKRLQERGTRSRFETQGEPNRELDFYRDARDFLATKGWKQSVVNCHARTPTEIAEIIYRQCSRPAST